MIGSAMSQVAMAWTSITSHPRAFLLYLGVLSALFFVIGFGLLAWESNDTEYHHDNLAFLFVGLGLASVGRTVHG